MPYPRIERVEREVVFSATATREIHRLQAGQRVIGASARVVVAGNGTGTVSLGKTAALTAYMTTAELGGAGPPAALKTVCSGADLNGNGTVYAAEMAVLLDYIQGTNSIHPTVRVTLLIVRDATWLDLLTQ